MEQDGQCIDRDADLVVLAGDIDEGTRGLRWARESFPDKPIIYVAGNHEFYEHSWGGLLDELHEQATKLDIAFLENQVLEYNGLRFLGCSLWTDFMLYGEQRQPSAMQAAQSWLNDYRWIHVQQQDIPQGMDWVNPGTLVPELTQVRHQESLAWLERELARGGPESTVVVTHHGPHPNSVPAQYLGDPLSPAFVSDLGHLMGKAKLWVHGHVHSSMDYVVNGTRVVCNPRGYAHRRGGQENEGFRSGWLVEV
uniref:Calcineurin-like phosphoesterase domain-containing protein n=1 Tax=Curvibacter symbiont subsp. Hydra magnipapillata TaxID=667019 RepID=C9Y727_CURXX|nr:hypothetical protein Csp_H40100 [Curvibacter putative symbiont of Hydra magnipapillata]